MVTSKRGTMDVQDVSNSITSFDENRLERLDVLDFEDFITQVPGANFISNGGAGRGNEVASIRGLSPVGDNTLAVVAQYLDGAPRFGENYRFFDIGEASVYRGPQGTLWGAQAIGGLVSFRSNRPDPTGYDASIQADVYSTEGDGGLSHRMAGHVNIPIVEDRFAVRVAAQHIDETGYIDNLTTGDDDVNAVEETAWRVSALARPTDWLDLTVIYHGNDLTSNAPSFFDIGLGDFQIEEPFTRNPANQAYDLFNFIVDADLGWAQLNYTGSYFDQERSVVDFDTNVYGFIPLARTDSIDEKSSWTHELRLSSTGERPLSWIAGVYYDDLETFDPQTQTQVDASGAPGSPPFVISVLGGAEDRRELAFFGEATYQFNDMWSVLVGGRYFDWEVDNREEFTYFGTNFQQETGVVGGDDFFWKAQLSFAPNDDQLFYVTRSEGFRFGGFNPFVGPALGIPEEFVKFDPDTLVNYEIGAHTSWLRDRLHVNGAIYSMDWSDIQTVVFNESATFAFTTNAPSLDAFGGEIEVMARDVFTDGLYVMASYAYTENEFTSDAVVYPGPALIEEGEELRRTPRQTWSLDVGYDFEIGSGANGFVRANYWHRDRTTTEGFNRADGAVPVPAQDVLNASGGVMFDRWQIKLYVDNVTDERPFMQIFPQAAAGAPGGDAPARASSIRPRTVGFELTRTFGG
ncbi:TonB-dependent receptor [Marinicauda salina]|nr:TonB-dependent receptor [Marinicauda salina]